MIRVVLDCFNSRLLMASATDHAGRAKMAKARGTWEKAHKESAASLDATAATPLTDESGSEHVDGQRRSHIYACQNLIRGSKSSVCSWRLKIRAQQVRSAAATMAARLAAVQHQHMTHTLPHLPSRSTGMHPLMMRYGYIRDTTLRKEVSTRRGRY